MLSDKQIQHHCLYGQGGRQCRYLESTYSSKGWKMIHNCQKLVSGVKRRIDKDVNTHIIQERKYGRDPMQGWQACGDGGSCSGYLYMPTLLQGYDVKTP